MHGYAAADFATDFEVAKDARIHIGNEVAVRSSNTVSDLLQGVTLNLKKAAPGTDVTVNVGTDVDAVVAKVKALATALDGVASTTNRSTAYNAATKTAGALTGDSAARSLGTTLYGAVSGQLSSGTYTLLSQLGISTTSEGGYTFDESKLRSALGTDPGATLSARSTTLSGVVTLPSPLSFSPLRPLAPSPCPRPSTGGSDGA